MSRHVTLLNLYIEKSTTVFQRHAKNTEQSTMLSERRRRSVQDEAFFHPILQHLIYYQHTALLHWNTITLFVHKRINTSGAYLNKYLKHFSLSQ